MWRPVQGFDLTGINGIADAIHVDHPERAEVFQERFRLFPDGFQLLEKDADRSLIGYGVAHPWRLNDVPALDSFLGSLPEAQCIHLHDIAILPEWRRQGLAGEYLRRMETLARSLNLFCLSLVAISSTDSLWTRYGFEVAANPRSLSSYRAGASYMVKSL